MFGIFSGPWTAGYATVSLFEESARLGSACFNDHQLS